MVGFLYQFGAQAAFLLLAAMGLAIIFGLMGIINLAHGEFIMAGAYITTLLVHAGVSFALAVIAGGIGVGILGIVLERGVFQFFYRKPLESLVISWGISLLLSQGCLILFGETIDGPAVDLGSIGLAGYTFSIYKILIGLIAACLMAGLFAIMQLTMYGKRVRATLDDVEIARAVGIKTSRIYMITFGIGAALAGIAGGLYAPIVAVSPTMGLAFIVPAFVTVVAAGSHNVMRALVPTVLLLAFVETLVISAFGQTMGSISLLIVVLVIIRTTRGGLSAVLWKA